MQSINNNIQMEDNIGLLINQFELAMEQINKQNQSNLDMLSDFIDIYDLAYQEIKTLRLQNIFRKNFPGVSDVLDALMIILQSPMNKVVHGIYILYKQVDGKMQEIKLDVIKPTSFDIAKQILQRQSFFNSIIYLDPRKINEEVIELFDACLTNKDKYLNADQVRRYSFEASVLWSWMLKIVEFCREYNKRNIKVQNYPKIRNIIQNIDQLLQREQQYLWQGQIKEKSEMEQAIVLIFECFKQQKSIRKIQTECLLKLRNKFDIKDWIQNKRPLYYWTTLDDEPAGIMFQWIAQLKKNSSLFEIVNAEYIGFDFLMLLNQSELDQISMLNLKPDLDEFSQFILDNLENVKLKNIQKLELNDNIIRIASNNQENERSLFQFLNQQQNITSLCLKQLSNKFIITEILQSFPCIKDFGCLSVKIGYVKQNNVETLMNEINKCNNLNKLTLKFHNEILSFDGPKFIDLSEGLNNIKSLQIFKIKKLTRLTGITINIIRFIEQQQSLLEFEYINQFLLGQKSDEEDYKELLKILKSKKIRCLKFKLNNGLIKQSLRRNMHKLKYAVQVKCC